MLILHATESGARVGSITAYDSFASTEDQNGAGSWTLKTSLDRFSAFDLLKMDQEARTDAYGMIAVDTDTGFIQSGRFDEPDINPLTGTVTLQGPLDTERLKGWISLPSPENPDPAGGRWATSSWARGGDAVEAIRDVINQNLGPTTGSRRMAGATITTFRDTPTRLTGISFVSEFDDLLDLADTYGTPSDVTVRVVNDGRGGYEISIREGRLLDQIVFAPWTGGVTSARIIYQADTGNAILMGGPGSAEDRIYDWTVGTRGTGVPRRERLVTGPSLDSDATDTEVLAALSAAGTRELATRQGGRVVEITLGDSSKWRFGADFGLGDLVTVNVGGRKTVEAVRSVRTSAKAGRLERKLITGTTTAGGDLLASSLTALSRKVHLTEVRRR